MIEVTFRPQEITVFANRGDTLLDIALDNGIKLEHECGGNCACTTCAVEILEGGHCLSLLLPEERERLATLEPEQKSPDTRLACQAILKIKGTVILRAVS